jgi:hypothetical protein
LDICAFAAPFKRPGIRRQIIIQQFLRQTGFDFFAIFFEWR